MECFLFFLCPCCDQPRTAVPDVPEKLLTAWSFCNRFTRLHRVSRPSKQKPKRSLWEKKLWKRTRWWIVSHKNFSGIYLWWVHILCFPKFSLSFHANSEPLILEGWRAYACLYQDLCCTRLNSLNCSCCLFVSMWRCQLVECRSVRYCLLGSEDPFDLRRFHNTPTPLNPQTSIREWNHSVRQWCRWFSANMSVAWKWRGWRHQWVLA